MCVLVGRDACSYAAVPTVVRQKIGIKTNRVLSEKTSLKDKVFTHREGLFTAAFRQFKVTEHLKKWVENGFLGCARMVLILICK